MDYLVSTDKYGDYESNPNIIADIASNTAIPVICLENFYVEDDTILYDFPKLGYRTQSASATTLIKSLTARRGLIQTRYTYKNTSYMVHMGQGLILSATGKVLLCLGIKKERFLLEAEGISYSDDLNFRIFSDDDYYRDYFVGYNEFILYISTDMFLQPEYEALYKKIQKDYINYCYLKGVEVRILASQTIEQNTFANEFKIQFNTIQELDYNLRNEVKFLLSNPVSYFVNHSLFVKQPTFDPPYIDTLEEEDDVLYENPSSQDIVDSIFNATQEAVTSESLTQNFRDETTPLSNINTSGIYSSIPRDLYSLGSLRMTENSSEDVEQRSQEDLQQTQENTSEDVSVDDLPFN